jgi:hypothetical protein
MFVMDPEKKKAINTDESYSRFVSSKYEKFNFLHGSS